MAFTVIDIVQHQNIQWIKILESCCTHAVNHPAPEGIVGDYQTVFKLLMGIVSGLERCAEKTIDAEEVFG